MITTEYGARWGADCLCSLPFSYVQAFRSIKVKDDKIDKLIKPPIVKYSGFNWANAHKLKPTGDAERDLLVASRLSNKN